MSDLRHDLAVLSVAYDALLESRDCDAVLEGAPLWSRPSRLLGWPLWIEVEYRMRPGGVVCYRPKSIIFAKSI